MSTPIDSLELEIKSNSQSAVNGLDALSKSLDKIRTATKGGLGLSAVATQLGKVRNEVSKMGNADVAKIKGIAYAIKTLSSVKVSSSIGNQLSKINTAMASLNIGDGGSKILELTEALRPLETLGKSSLGTTVNALNKLPDALKKIDTRQLYTQVQSLTRIFKPLADEMQKVANGFNAFPTRIQRLIQDNQRLTQSNNTVKGSYINLWAKMRMAYNGVKTTSRLISSSITKINDYIENVNLFNVSMGEYAKEAGVYAERVGEIMGIDPGEWMRNQGVFMTLATGFGVVNDRAYTMSKNLTQLGYDISSFFNISYEDAMQKLQSGLAGELEPLRRIGYDLSQARLQQEAYTLGINKKVAAMTQAEKAELRYHAIMTQVTTSHGDMARTLDAPANQLRVLSSQITQAGRAIGSIFIPALNAVLPYIIAITKVVRILAETLASLFGFEMPEVDYSGIGSLASGADDASSALGSAADNAKKLKQYTMGFDELNVIDPNKGDSGDDSTGIGGGFKFELPEYDFISNAVNTEIEKIMTKISPALETIKGNMEEIWNIVLSIGSGVIAWNLTGIATSLLKAIKDNKIDKPKLGITLMATGITLGLANGYDIGKDGLSWDKLFYQALSNALIVGGSLLTFGTGPAGWTIGIATALVIDIASISWGKWEKAKEDDLANRFGEYELSDSQIADWVSKLTTSELSVEIGMFINEQESVKNAKTQVESAITTLNSYNFKIQCGLDVSQSEYESAVDTLIESAQGYIGQKQLTAAIALNISFGDSSTGNRLSDFVNEFYTTNSTELSNLGEKLKTTVSEGFVDGEWIPNKLQEAIELQEEIQEILNYISNVEFEAKLETLKLDASGTDITSDSFTELINQASDTIQEKIGTLEDIRLESIKIAKMEFDQNILGGMSKEAATQIYETAIAEANSKFQEGKLSLTYGTYEFGIDVLTEKYSNEISKVVPLFQQSTQDLFLQGTMAVMPEDCYTNIDNLMLQLQGAFDTGIKGLDISSAAKSNVSKLMESLKPTKAQLEDVANKAKEAGKAVPKEVSEGLKNASLLESVAGDTTAIAYLIGDKLSTDTEFLNMLATCEDAGKSVNEYTASGLTNNLQVVEDASNGTITLINDTIGEKVFEVTPTLVQNLKDLGINLSNGVLTGAQDAMVSNKQSWTTWAWLPWNWFKETNEIHSPSKLFYRGGTDIIQGLWNGFAEKWDELIVWWKGLSLPELEFKMPHFKWTTTPAPNWIAPVMEFLNIPASFPKLNVEWYANGGFPTTGQMFIAREAGAEMVGSIGRRTAVANNDQIVEGIASGVASANSESNALLREQNSLLRAMLEKESGVYLDGKKITKSVDKYKREQGRVLVTGGAY